MPAIVSFSDPDDLDIQTSLAIDQITKERLQKKVLALSFLGGALLALLGMTYAMYARAPANPGEPTGTSTRR
jgi:hypothetical protein